jgi:hypothetical protein
MFLRHLAATVLGILPAKLLHVATLQVSGAALVQPEWASSSYSAKQAPALALYMRRGLICDLGG